MLYEPARVLYNQFCIVYELLSENRMTNIFYR